jgi:puromycin-sensitive aminopeptidase
VDPYRLPQTVVPQRYDLRLDPDLTASAFSGEVTIAILVKEPTSEIVLNAIELDIQNAALLDDAGAAHPARVMLEEATERCRLTFSSALAPGPTRLRIAFRGTLNDKLRGFYRSTYRDANGASKVLAATQFEATDARRAFPCWDEPAFKAVFAATLVIDPKLTAISNTAISSEAMENGKKVVRFADTIPMSTYLVAFVVGELEATTPTFIGNTPLRVWCVPGKARLAAFGQAIGAFSLDFFEKYYARQYPGDKLDLLAIPDFAAGAMENLGAITFRETALLVDEAAATHAEQERVADVVAHENAHMWFGDLVTMEWWNGLWLNEAFATFMEMLAVDAWKPEWQRWTTFGVSRSAALSVDGLHSTRPIEYAVAAPRDADAMFDVLTYEKGASVLRMLEQYLGEDMFRDGVREYLRRHEYRNTHTCDLWVALGAASGQPIPEMMDGWIFHPGYPLVNAAVENGRLWLTQQRFSYLPANANASSPLFPEARGESRGARAEGGTTQRWRIPLQVRINARGKSRLERLMLTEAETRLDLPDGFESALVNEGGHGFYRVRYAPDLLAQLLDRLPDGLSAIERFNLVNDAWAAVLAGLMPLADYLNLTGKFRAERDKNVWTILIGSFQTLNRVRLEADGPALEAFTRDRLGPAVAELGWQVRPAESELTRQLRGDLLRALGTLGNDPTTQGQAVSLFTQGRLPADANIEAAVIPILAHIGDAARYDDFLSRFRTAATPQIEQRFLYALAAFRQPELIERTLVGTLDGPFRTQDAPLLLRAMLMGVHSRDLTWAFVQANWDKMSKAYPTNGLRRLCEGVLGLATPEREVEVRRFFVERKVDLGGKTLAQYLEQLRILVSLRDREAVGFRAALTR